MDGIGTKTMAQIYLRQGDFRKAFDILVQLADRNPADLEIAELLVEARKKISGPSKEAKIAALKRWLTRIEERRSE
jgi:hypothetical protein